MSVTVAMLSCAPMQPDVSHHAPYLRCNTLADSVVALLDGGVAAFLAKVLLITAHSITVLF